MEVKTWDAVVVSAFGRGHWLAVEMQSQGLSVFLLDVSSKLGNWPPEDIEGPFGLFMQEQYEQTYQEYLSHFDNYAATEGGFAVWTSQGPLEFKSSLTNYRFQKLGLDPHIRDLLTNQNLAAKSAEENFEKTWPLHLAHQLASTTYQPNRKGSTSGQALPLLSTFLVRSASRAKADHSLEWAESKGVSTSNTSEILDVALAGRKEVSGLELKGQPSGVVRFKNLVWSLTSEETYFMNERVGQKLFPHGYIESTWAWMRFRVKVKDCHEIEVMPPNVCLIKDLGAPWTHENLCIIQKTAVKENLDVWIRIPTVQRFNKEYLKDMGERVVKILSENIPPADPEIQAYPQPYYYTYKELGGPRFPVFDEKDNPSRRYSAFHNFYRDGYEAWSNLTRDSQYIRQSEIRDEIVKQWKQEQLKKREKELRS
jgi:hypothetical protein